MPQQAAGQFGRAGLRPREEADRVEPRFANETPPTAAEIEAEIEHFRRTGEPSTPSPPPPSPSAETPLPAPDAVEQARQHWAAEERQRLADAEAVWEARNRNRVATARMTVQRADATMQELHRQLADAQKSLTEKNAELAKAWAACEQERMRVPNSPIAAQERKAARELAFERRAKIALRLTCRAAWTTLVVALALLAFQRSAPVAASLWKQETGPNSRLRTLLSATTAEKVPAWTVAAPIANLRSRPLSSAPILMVLPLNASVTQVAARGKWSFVRVGEGAAAQQGWVLTSSLQAPKR